MLNFFKIYLRENFFYDKKNIKYFQDISLNIIEKFKTLPSSLGIRVNKDHFEFLDIIIEKELKEFSEKTQKLFEKLMLSFSSKKMPLMNEREKKKIQNLFLHNTKYRKSLELLYKNIREQFRFAN